jgi:hypothetical protein
LTTKIAKRTERFLVPASAIALAIRGSATFAGGPTWPLLCDAIGNAVSAWAVVPGNVVLAGVTNGVIGAGTSTGLLVFNASPSLAVAAMTSGGLAGESASQVGQAIALGLLASLSGSVPYQGVSVGVSSGVDVSSVTFVNTAALGAALQAAHLSATAALGGSGSRTPVLYTSLASGIAVIIATGTTLLGTGVVAPVGPVGPASGVGSSVSAPI